VYHGVIVRYTDTIIVHPSTIVVHLFQDAVAQTFVKLGYEYSKRESEDQEDDQSVSASSLREPSPWT
jgi:hypothetical protein